nr:bifunctional diguanylate cyclase/phosphodiesterase [Actinomycetota bacterium]
MATSTEQPARRAAPEERSGGPARRRLAVALGVWAVLAVVCLVSGYPWLSLAVSAIGSSVVIAVAIRRRGPSSSWPWWCIVLAFVLFLAGNVIRQGEQISRVLEGGRSLVPDSIIIPGYGLLLVALVGFVRERERVRRHSLGIVLDGLMAALALLALCWVFLIEPVLAHRDVGSVVRLVVLLYPSMSFALVVMMLQIAFGAGRRPGLSERYLVVAVSSMFAGDVLATLNLLSIVDALRAMDLVYVTALVAAAAGALDPSMRELTEPAKGAPASWPVGRIGLVALALSVPALLVLRTGQGAIGPRVVLFGIIILLTGTAILQILRALRVAEQSEARLSFQALHDALTGLPNRAMMERHLRGALARAATDESPVSLLFLDIDRFKLINDTVGHTLGDELLVQVASRLQKNVRPTDLVTRIGGDEFVVVLGQTVGVADALEFANRLRYCLREPFTIDETEFFVTASIGLACVPGGAPDVSAEVLIRDADTAMYRAKEAGRDAVAVFDDSMRAQLAERVEIERDLRHAVARHELHLAFQPIVSATTGSIVSVEALVRWLHPTLGVIMPTRFIPLAEESELIVEIGS